MKNLKLNIDKQLEMMAYYNLTAEEVLIIELLFLGSIEERHKEYLLKYLRIESGAESFRDILISLTEKGIILKSYKIPNVGEAFDPEEIPFNKNFLNRYVKYSGIMGAELYEAYPHFIQIDGIAYDIANFAKKFDSEEDFHFAYGKAISWNPDRHREVLELIEWAKENTTYLKFNICDFVISKGWRRIKELKELGQNGIDKQNNNIETL